MTVLLRARASALWSRFWKSEDGQDLVEYALLLSFVALAAISILTAFGTTEKGIWTNINTTLISAAS